MLETQIPIAELVLRLALATFFGMIIGWELEVPDKPAGLRTHMMVGLGSAAFFVVTLEFVLGPLNEIENISPDPTRIVQGVIGGIGFLGAGSIIQGQRDVKGLTTGAGIWVVGAVGLACGGGYYVIAVIATLFALTILVVIGLMQRHFKSQSNR